MRKLSTKKRTPKPSQQHKITSLVAYGGGFGHGLLVITGSAVFPGRNERASPIIEPKLEAALKYCLTSYDESDVGTRTYLLVWFS